MASDNWSDVSDGITDTADELESPWRLMQIAPHVYNVLSVSPDISLTLPLTEDSLATPLTIICRCLTLMELSQRNFLGNKINSLQADSKERRKLNN